MGKKTLIAIIALIFALIVVIVVVYYALPEASDQPDQYDPYESAAEYTLPQDTIAADSYSDFYLVVDAAKRHDYASVLALEAQGKAFILESGTLVLAGGTGGICAGEVRSGEYISKHVVLACAQLN